MLDGDVLPLHDDPLNEQADEPLASGEVEPLQAIADGCCEGRDVGGQRAPSACYACRDWARARVA
jgi:hypothetical protein